MTRTPARKRRCCRRRSRGGWGSGAETLAPRGIDGRHYGVLAILSELGPVSQQTHNFHLTGPGAGRRIRADGPIAGPDVA